MHEGKLFKFQATSFDELSTGIPHGQRKKKPSRTIEFFWLCNACAEVMTLVRQPYTHKVVVVPRKDGPRCEHSGLASDDDRNSARG